MPLRGGSIRYGLNERNGVGVPSAYWLQNPEGFRCLDSCSFYRKWPANYFFSGEKRPRICDRKKDYIKQMGPERDVPDIQMCPDFHDDRVPLNKNPE